MKFRSNNCIAIHVKNLSKAERFYKKVLGFKLRKKTRSHLEFDTGVFRLYVNKAKKARSPVPSFNVAKIVTAKRFLKKNGCRIAKDWGKALYFKDPFGFVWDIIEKS